jgi:hypothetical protein
MFVCFRRYGSVCLPFGLQGPTVEYDKSLMKRATLILDGPEVKRLAAERGETISAIVDQFLAKGIRRATAPKKRRVPLPVFEMGEPS